MQIQQDLAFILVQKSAARVRNALIFKELNFAVFATRVKESGLGAPAVLHGSKYTIG
jgi:hypothetical protein